ncbi:MAG: hypothetical protein JW793_03350 [Acidobacteria bacterium]|nr:hypothetical protein [Acidobacteriota bacterium]
MRKAYRFTWMLAVVIILYLGWVFYSRWSENRAFEQRVEELQESRESTISKTYGELKILGFYATPPAVGPGEKAQLCYSVTSAESVRIEPHVENVWPSISRCVEVAPAENTTYRLVAEDAEGKTVTAETTVEVYVVHNF